MSNQIHEKKTGIFISLLLSIYSIIMSTLVFVMNSIILIINNLVNLFYKILLESLFSISHTINIFLTITLSNLFFVIISYISGVMTAFLFFRSSKKSD
jgi:hypothetical protein